MSDERTPLLNESNHSISSGEETMGFRKNLNPQILEVYNLHYQVNLRPDWRLRVKNCDPFGKKTLEKKILQDVSLTAQPGKLLAILGSSGSGKTSLLDLLACRTQGGHAVGEVLLNGKPATQALIRKTGAYVTQEDKFLPNLTVQETLMFVAHMKFPSSLGHEKKLARVQLVIAELGLRHVANTIIGGETVKGISGGEKRRVSIGAQLLLDPSILFLDEPTSGLDSFTAAYIINTLVSLSRSNRTIITTIHSPRTDIFNMFDDVLLLSQGETVYFGEAEKMVAYFDDLGFHCPKYSNPCDYFMDISTIDFRGIEQTQKSREIVDLLVQKFKDYHYKKVKRSSTTDSARSFTDAKEPVVASLNGFLQFKYLYLRASKNLLYGLKELIYEGGEAIMMGVIIGTIYFEIGYSQVSITDRYGLFFILSSLFPFMVILNTIAQFDKERPSFYNERQDGLYDLLPYFFSKTYSELPFNILFALLYAIPSYYLIGLNPDPASFIRYLAIITLSIYASRSIALATASGIVNFQQACFIGNLTYTLFLIPSGFLVNLDTIWAGVAWVADISYLRFSFEALAVNEFTGLEFNCDENYAGYSTYANGTRCAIETGEEALRFFSLGDTSIPENMIYLIVVVLFFRMFQYLFLRFVNQRPN